MCCHSKDKHEHEHAHGAESMCTMAMSTATRPPLIPTKNNT